MGCCLRSSCTSSSYSGLLTTELIPVEIPARADQAPGPGRRMLICCGQIRILGTVRVGPRALFAIADKLLRTYIESCQNVCCCRGGSEQTVSIIDATSEAIALPDELQVAPLTTTKQSHPVITARTEQVNSKTVSFFSCVSRSTCRVLH